MHGSSTPISICIPVYNRAQYVCEAVESALGQGDSDTEIIVVDDGSTDDTSERIEKFADRGVFCFHKEHTNAPDTYNRCIREANGSFILWLDSDDILPEGLVGKFRETFEKYPDADVFYGDMNPFGNVGKIKGKTIACLDYYGRNSLLLSRMIYSNRLPASGAFIRKDLFSKAGYYDTRFHRAHDYEFYSRAVFMAKFKHLGMTAINWRWHENNLSMNKPPGGHSFEASVVKKMLDRYPLSLLFPGFSWHEPRQAAFMANTELAKIFLLHRDPESAIFRFEQAFQCMNTEGALPRFRQARLEIISENYRQMFERTGNKYFSGAADVVNGLSGSAVLCGETNF